MRVSEQLIELIGNYGLKGFRINDNNRIVPVCKLYEADLNAIRNAMVDLRGDLSIMEFANMVEEAVRLEDKYYSQVIVADIEVGSLLRLTLDSKQIIELVYLGDHSFCVCKDSVYTLQPMDILQCISQEYQVNKEAYFRLLRNGTPYPNEKRLLRVCIRKIAVSNNRIKGMPSIEPVRKVCTSKDKVYAWQAEMRPQRFTQNLLTTNQEALYTLDIKTKKFMVNIHYCPSHIFYRDNVTSLITTACNVRRTDKGLENLMEGHFELYRRDSGKFEFVITKKAEIGI